VTIARTVRQQHPRDRGDDRAELCALRDRAAHTRFHHLTRLPAPSGSAAVISFACILIALWGGVQPGRDLRQGLITSTGLISPQRRLFCQAAHRGDFFAMTKPEIKNCSPSGMPVRTLCHRLKHVFGCHRAAETGHRGINYPSYLRLIPFDNTRQTFRCEYPAPSASMARCFSRLRHP